MIHFGFQYATMVNHHQLISKIVVTYLELLLFSPKDLTTVNDFKKDRSKSELNIVWPSNDVPAEIVRNAGVSGQFPLEHHRWAAR